MTIIKVALIFLYSKVKKKMRKIRSIFDLENDFESQNFDVFDLQF